MAVAGYLGTLGLFSGASHTSSLNRSLAVKPFTTVAGVFLALMAAVHLLRLFAGWEVTVVGFVIPVWWSALGLLIPGGLALMLWREAQRDEA